MCWKKLRKTQRSGKIFHAHGLEKTNIVKMFILPKPIYRLSAIFIKTPRTFFTEINKCFSKIKWNHTRPRIAKVIPRKKEQCWRYHTLWFQTILQTIVRVLATWYWQNSMVLGVGSVEYRDQQNRTESPEINPSICERIVSSITGAGKIRRSHAKKKSETRPLFHTIHKNYLTID